MLKPNPQLTLTPALSHRMGEGESFSVGRRIQPLWKLRETGLAVPSPVGRERVRVRVVLLEIHLLPGTCLVLWRSVHLPPGHPELNLSPPCLLNQSKPNRRASKRLSPACRKRILMRTAN